MVTLSKESLSNGRFDKAFNRDDFNMLNVGGFDSLGILWVQ